jgi:hypothetical protein
MPYRIRLFTGFAFFFVFAGLRFFISVGNRIGVKK